MSENYHLVAPSFWKVEKKLERKEVLYCKQWYFRGFVFFFPKKNYWYNSGKVHAAARNIVFPSSSLPIPPVSCLHPESFVWRIHEKFLLGKLLHCCTSPIHSWNKDIALSTLAWSALVLFIFSPYAFSQFRAKSTTLNIQIHIIISAGNFSYFNTRGLQKLDWHQLLASKLPSSRIRMGRQKLMTPCCKINTKFWDLTIFMKIGTFK